MFDVGFSELVLIALLALIVLGPKRLPEVARTAGRWLGKLRRFMTDVRQDFDRELRTAELEELRKLKEELDDTRRLMEQSSQQMFRDIGSELETSGATVAPPADTKTAAADETPAIEAPSPPPDSNVTAPETTERPARRRPAAKKNGPARRTRR